MDHLGLRQPRTHSPKRPPISYASAVSGLSSRRPGTIQTRDQPQRAPQPPQSHPRPGTIQPRDQPQRAPQPPQSHPRSGTIQPRGQPQRAPQPSQCQPRPGTIQPRDEPQRAPQPPQCQSRPGTIQPRDQPQRTPQPSPQPPQCQPTLTQPSRGVLRQWGREQLDLKKHLQLRNSDRIKAMLSKIPGRNTRQYYVGGVDISFIKGDDVNACAALVVMAYPQMQVVHEETRMVKLTVPYVCGYLGYREVPHFKVLLESLQATKPHLTPDVVMVDGNGILHPKGFGSACRLGVLLGIPTIGIGKTLHRFDGIGIAHDQKIGSLRYPGDRFDLVGKTSKSVVGVTLLTPYARDPIYVSPRHMVDMRSSSELVLRCSSGRLPDPVYLADRISRDYIENNYYGTSTRRNRITGLGHT